MIKYLGIVLILLLQGCQIKGVTPPLTTPKPSCEIGTQALFRMQSIEKRFLKSPEKRSSLLKSAIDNKDRALIALLMSTPYASTEQLQQAKRHYAKLKLNIKDDCAGDKYLNLRNQHTSALLWLRAEQDKLTQKNQSLQIKIDALTQIESDLNQQREDN
ncbi:hypothetical protein [Neptuniibacter sp.]|jgi:hypothetical protein|uniref:hypothetical protein n=1 Tax=Neptuniibacter sp. TaxID=1962643 RepID=UPI003B5B79B9